MLTHRRRRLATGLVRSLIAEEGFDRQQVVLVIDRDGGLEDRELERSIRVVRLAENSGPAAGFRAGLDAAFADPDVAWAYLCEDDIGLFNLPAPRVAPVLAEVERHERDGGAPVGAVVAYGRRYGSRPGATDPYLPAADGPRLQPVDVAAWGATLVSRRVYDAGVRPDDYWFFAYEDFDFYWRVKKAGLAVMVDRDSGRATAVQTATLDGRDAALAGERPDDVQEAWRAYYVARNVFELARRHGDWRWLGWHLLLSARRFQLARSAAERRAMLVGLFDGVRGRSGRNSRYVRQVGELPVAVADPSPVEELVRPVTTDEG